MLQTHQTTESNLSKALYDIAKYLISEIQIFFLSRVVYLLQQE